MISKDNLLYIFKYLILTISIFVLNFILVFKASALETRYPSSQVVKDGVNWYGYNLPTRATLTDSLGSSVYMNISVSPATSSDHWTSKYSNHLKVGLRSLPNQVIDSLSSTDTGNLDYIEYYNIPKLWSETYTLPLANFNNYFSFGFQPGVSVNTDEEVLEDGYAINYDSIYSYDFDIVVNSEDNIRPNLLGSLQLCTINSVTNDYGCITYGSNYYSYELIYTSDKVQYYRYHIKFNQYTFGYGFNYVVLEDSNNQYNMSGKNLFGNSLALYVQGSVSNLDNLSFTISEPYNIVLWNNKSSMVCTDSCWTQQDSDNSQRILNDSNYLWNQLQDYVDSFKYYGFGGIVTLTYNYIIDLLQDNSCPVLNVPVLTKSFNLPSACSFWNREDVSTFDSLWSMVWLGLVSYYVCWRIFKDILRLYDPSTSVIEGNEVADL